MNARFITIGLLVGLTLGTIRAAESIKPPDVDPGLRVSDGSVPLLKVAAKGVQIYTCKPTVADPSKFAYDKDHSEPDAVLTNGPPGQIIIHHYLNFDPAGPAWESTDGSKVVGKKLDPAQPRPDTIPWLKLQAVATSGDGMLSKVTFIQRVDTQGGTAPAGACVSGSRVRVDYRATYYFYGPLAKKY